MWVSDDIIEDNPNYSNFLKDYFVCNYNQFLANVVNH